MTINKRRIDFSIKRKIDTLSWHEQKGRAKPISEENIMLNSLLEQIRSKIVNHYQELILEGKKITIKAIKNKYFGIEENESTLQKLVTYHNDVMKKVLATGTLKNYYTTQKYLERFVTKITGEDDIGLSEINYKFITDFEFFLRSWKPVDHQRPLNNNGVMKHMERFQKLINLAKKLEWIKTDPFANYSLKFEKVIRDFLTLDELTRIEEKEFKIQRLQQVKDLFVFSCYTGLSYIDLVNLKPDNITIGIDGMKWINTTRQKSMNQVKVPLLPKAIEILEKYKIQPKVLNENKLLPGFSNQKLNTYLKEIADLCEINKNLTFHIARHTFATTVTLTNGVPIESISKMLGHTKLSTTQIYAKVIETKVSHDMSALKYKLDTMNKTAQQNQFRD